MSTILHFLKTLPVAAVALTPPAALAHAFLASATPAVGSKVATAPDAVTITFTESVEPAFSTITVVDASGTRVDKNDVHLAGDGRQLAVSLTPPPAGTYKVIWHATSTDTHKTEGSFIFTVKP